MPGVYSVQCTLYTGTAHPRVESAGEASGQRRRGTADSILFHDTRLIHPMKLYNVRRIYVCWGSHRGVVIRGNTTLYIERRP